MAKKLTVVAENEITKLQPEKLVLGDNVRFGLKRSRIDELKRKIVELGGVQTALKVEPLGDGKFVVREGNYRTVAVTELNKEGANLTLPCVVESPTDPVRRIQLQISENLDRENLSPMDVAITMNKLKELGQSRTEIRSLFTRPGGRKGVAIEPMSNATYHKYLFFLNFPKEIQEMIHDGRLPVGTAIVLTSKPADQWSAILANVEAARIKEIESEDKAEEKYLEQERKEAADLAKIEELKKSKDEHAKAQEQWKAKAEASVTEAAELFKKTATVTGDEKKAAEKEFRAVKSEADVAETKAKDEAKEIVKIEAQLKVHEEKQAERQKKLEEARKASIQAANAKPIHPAEVQRASAAVGSTGPVPLNITNIRQYTHDLCLPGSFPKVQGIGLSLRKAWAGEITYNQLVSELAYITGERKEKPKTITAPKEAEVVKPKVVKGAA